MAAEQQRPAASARASANETATASAPAAEYRPGPNTIWLCEDRSRWDQECREYLIDRYGAMSGAILQVLPTQRLGPSHEIVVLFRVTKRIPKIDENGRRRKGVAVESKVAQSSVVRCADFYLEPNGLGAIDISVDLQVGGGIQVTDLRDGTGRSVPGLAQALTNACMVEGDQRDRRGQIVKVPTVRAIYRADTHDLRMARDA